MNAVPHTIWLLGLSLAFASVAAAEEPTSFQKRADDYLAKLTKDESFSGAVLVAQDGKAIFAKGYGLANREHKIANVAETKFRLGSVTKQFTAMCILLLQEDEKLKTTDLISKHVKDCPDAWKEITIHHLLTHTSGIPSFTSFADNLVFERLPATTEQTVKRFREKPLQFEPGSQMRYSNSGYVLLGFIIETVSGDSYENFVTERIFKPLGMKNSGYDHPADILPKRASGYSRRFRGVVNCIPFAMDTPHAAGALYSTVEDLLLWNEALNTEQLVSKAAMKQMFTPFKNNYCYGWNQAQSDAGRLRFEHAGAISGFATDVIRFPNENVFVVVLSNGDWVNSRHIARELSDRFFSEEK